MSGVTVYARLNLVRRHRFYRSFLAVFENSARWTNFRTVPPKSIVAQSGRGAERRVRHVDSETRVLKKKFGQGGARSRSCKIFFGLTRLPRDFGIDDEPE